MPRLRALMLAACVLAPSARAQKCHAPQNDAECPKGQGMDCLTKASGMCAPAAWKTDTFCDTRMLCGTKRSEDNTCKFCREEKCLPAHKDSHDSGGLFVTDHSTARVFAYVPETQADANAGVSDKGDFRIAMGQGSGLEAFRLNGNIAVGIGARNSKYVYAIASSKTDHQLYALDRLTGQVTKKSLINFPKGWVKTKTSTASTWRYKLPEALKAHHPCRCTGADTNFHQGSGLPWSTGLRAAETLTSDSSFEKHAGMGFKTAVKEQYWPKAFKDTYRKYTGKGALSPYDMNGLAVSNWRLKAGYQTIVHSPYTDWSKVGGPPDDKKLAELRKNVTAYPMVHADDKLFGTKDRQQPVLKATAKALKGTRMCPLLEPLLCSSQKLKKRVAFGGPDYGFKTDFNTAVDGVPTAPAQSSWHAGTTSAEAATRRVEMGEFCAGSPGKLDLDRDADLYYCIPRCCGCTYGLCDNKLAGADPEAAWELNFNDGNSGDGWRGLVMAPYDDTNSPRDTDLVTSASNAFRMYAVAQGYGVLKYDVAADGTPTFVGTVLACQDVRGRRMQGYLAKLTADAPGGKGHKEGMFVVCQNRLHPQYDDATAIFYCALDTGKGSVSWREHGRCAYVMGHREARRETDGSNKVITEFAPKFDGAEIKKQQDQVLRHQRVRDLTILSATDSNGVSTYDVVAVEGSYPNSQMSRYEIKIKHGVKQAYPQVTAVKGEEFLDAKSTTANDGTRTELGKAVGKDAFDLGAAAVGPEKNKATRPGVMPSRTPSNTVKGVLYVTDFSAFNPMLRMEYALTGKAIMASVKTMGNKQSMVPTGVPFFIDGPVAAQSTVEGIKDTVAGTTVYLKITAHNFAGYKSDEGGGTIAGAHITVKLAGTVSIGGEDASAQQVKLEVPGRVIARTDGENKAVEIYQKGCCPKWDESDARQCVCPANVYWATYSSVQAGKFDVVVTMGPFDSPVITLPKAAPSKIEIVAADAEPSKSVVVREDGESGSTKAGNPSIILIETFDRFGNRRKVGTAEKFEWSLKQGPDEMNTINNRDTYDDNPIDTKPTEFKLKDGCDTRAGKNAYSRLQAKYTAYRAGTFQFTVVQKGTVIYTDTVRIHPAKIAASKCTVASKHFSSSANIDDVQTLTGSTVAVDVFPKDEYKNPVDAKVKFIVTRTGYANADYTLECYKDSKAIYQCEATWKEERENKYSVIVYLAEPDSSNSSKFNKRGVGDPEASAAMPSGWIFASKSTVSCEDLEDVHFYINVFSTLVIVLGIAMSIWLIISNRSTFIQMTSPILGQVIIWGGIFHLFSCILWTIDPNESGVSGSDVMNMCAIRMWLFGMTFVMMWGTLALKTYRVRVLVMGESESASGYRELSDSRLLTYLLGMLVVEIIILMVYTFSDADDNGIAGPEYIPTDCGRVDCGNKDDMGWIVFVAMSTAYKGAIIFFAILEAKNTRHVAKQDVEGANSASASNSAAAFVEAPHIGFSIYNMAFTSIVLYPITALTNSDTKTYAVLRALASIWSCFIVYVFVFGLKIRDKAKFESTERQNRAQKLQQHRNAGGNNAEDYRSGRWHVDNSERQMSFYENGGGGGGGNGGGGSAVAMNNPVAGSQYTPPGRPAPRLARPGGAAGGRVTGGRGGGRVTGGGGRMTGGGGRVERPGGPAMRPTSPARGGPPPGQY